MSAFTVAPNISIDLLTDLKDGCHLKERLEAEKKAVLSLAREFTRFADQQIEAAVGVAPVKVTISVPATWTTTTGIGFSLTPSASCTLAIATSSTKFDVAKSIRSKDTNDIVSGPANGKVYVNIEMDFSITGSVSGSGAIGSVGISGKASGSGSATLSYCHAVDATTNTVDAIKAAFSNLVFPFEPDCAPRMGVGDVGRVNFDGSLAFGLSVSYGLGSYQFSAPGAAAVLQSSVEKLTPPSVNVNAGAKASFSYTHKDHFTAIIQKVDAQTANMYLLRSSANEIGVSAGITVGISVTSASVTVDKNVLSSAVNSVTGSGGDKAAALADQLQSSLEGKGMDWLSSQKTDAGLMVQLSRQSNRALLYAFKVDLANPAAMAQSWQELAKGNVAQAVQIGGMTLLPGSGVGTELKQSVSVGLHFFNFFNISDATTYFNNAYTEIGPDGSIRFFSDLGKESEGKTKSTLQTSRIHFVASATPGDADSIKNVAVDLCLELSETNRVNDGNLIASVPNPLLPSAPLIDAQAAMRQFLTQTGKGKLTLAITWKSSAYRRLTCSPFTGAKHDIPPALPQSDDRTNWMAYRDAASVLERLDFVSKLKYDDWQVFNLLSNQASGVPNRRMIGDLSAGTVPPSFYTDRNIGDVALFASNFLQSSACFMNLCDDLMALAGLVGEIDTLTGWNSLLGSLTALAKSFQADWSRSSASALLQLCGSGANIQATVQTTAGSSPCVTCNVTVG